MKYCINCGTPLEDSMRFCSECGTEQPAGRAQNGGGPSGASSAQETSQANAGNFASQSQYGAYGAPTMPSYPGMQREKPKSNGLAIGGFVVSLCAVLFVFIPVAGLLVSLTGLGLSIAGMMLASRTKGASGMAVAGLVLSLVFGLTSLYYLFGGF